MDHCEGTTWIVEDLKEEARAQIVRFGQIAEIVEGLVHASVVFHYFTLSIGVILGPSGWGCDKRLKESRGVTFSLGMN